MALPRVSILIPTYNRADYLLAALDSALHQTFSELEIIVVDDGSMDDTAEVIRKYTDPRLQFIQQKNCGVSAALNTAWRAARSEFIAMLGSDDEMLPAQIETLLNYIEREPTLGMVYGRAQAMDAQG
ncbi:MAG TPA: glycosyltransferase family 2 protein, partial [Anaerolineae bacterium]|nr:glycosyltransferase family 2 protein [Anaerolineae bacterium]